MRIDAVEKTIALNLTLFPVERERFPGRAERRAPPKMSKLQRPRRDIFVETQPNKSPAPSGAASSGKRGYRRHAAKRQTDDAAPDGAH